MKAEPFQFNLQAIFIVVTLASLILTIPQVLALALPFVIGGRCIYVAYSKRPHGWKSGLLFGILIVGMGCVNFVLLVLF